MLSILIAKDRDAKFCVDNYSIGWLHIDNNGKDWLWATWGLCKTIEQALDCAKSIIEEKGERKVYLSETPLCTELKVQNEKLNLKQLI
jgi:hypothetical protein